jgi:hypothetical protein
MTSTVVDIEVWTRKRVTAGDTITRYTLVYVEDGKTYRVATRETEFEARRFARAHHWIVGRVFDEEAAS